MVEKRVTPFRKWTSERARRYVFWQLSSSPEHRIGWSASGNPLFKLRRIAKLDQWPMKRRHKRATGEW